MGPFKHTVDDGLDIRKVSLAFLAPFFIDLIFVLSESKYLFDMLRGRDTK